MSDRRYVVAYGDFLHREVGRAPDAESGDFLTKAEAARRIVSEMNAAIEMARASRRHAMRILKSEHKKEAGR